MENSERFFNGEYDTMHVGELDVEPFTEEERQALWKNYSNLPSLLEKIGTGRK